MRTTTRACTPSRRVYLGTPLLAVLPAPVLVGEFASIDELGKKQYCKVTALGICPSMLASMMMI